MFTYLLAYRECTECLTLRLRAPRTRSSSTTINMIAFYLTVAVILDTFVVQCTIYPIPITNPI